MTSLFQKPAHHACLIIFLLGGTFGLSYTDAKGIRALWTLTHENQVVVQELQSLHTRLQELTRDIENFKTQSSMQERQVRLQTGYLRQNELLIEWL